MSISGEAVSGIGGGAEKKSVDIAVRIMRGAVAAKASDVHLKADAVPLVRIGGELCTLEHPPVPEVVVQSAVRAMASWSKFDATKLEGNQADFAVEVPEAGRWRVHAYRQSGKRACVMRHIPMPVPDFAQLRLPPVIKQIATAARGLVIVAGATGNGKSTTIASMLSFLNQQEPKHVVTIEDPVEFRLDDELCSFSFREIGLDVDSFEQGIAGAMREDPDVIFLGEMRTLQQFDSALYAAESGRLVISTFHAADVVQALNRMVSFYPVDARESVAHRLADAVTAIVCQRLVPRRGARERILVTEVLRRTPLVQDCIRDPGRIRSVHTALERSTNEFGTHTFDQQLLRLVKDKLVDVNTAKAMANSPHNLVRALNISR
ncbi:MAG: PilT/PilU family type 4a pilus ATPase [Myxococcota bacterium]